MNQQTVRHDPIVEEIHATRERLANQYHNNLLAYSQAAEAHYIALGFRIVEDTKRRASEDVGAIAARA